MVGEHTRDIKIEEDGVVAGVASTFYAMLSPENS